MNIQKNLISRNHTAKKRSKSDIQWIVVHYVGALGDAKANTDYYKSNDVGASADFFVGFAGDVWQANDYYNYYSWHCGGGYQSSWTQNGGGQFYQQCTNSNSVGIEMCVRKKSTATMNATDTDWYFEQATVDATAELVAYLMKELNIDINHVIRHYDVNRKICPNPMVVDNNKWISFKKKVAELSGSVVIDVKEIKWYRVGVAWADGKCQGQLGAYEVLQNAKDNCPVGYKVFDSDGKVVYENKSVGGTHSADFNGLTEVQCAAKILEMARADGKKTGILPSVTAAQGILESGYMRTTELVKKADNAFGMKVVLSGNTWNTVWDGKSKVNIRTPEEYTPGVITYIYADFRKYPNLETSMEDHGRYLLGAMNGTKKRYDGLTKCKNFKEAITLIKNGGYATDSQYVNKICNIIERYGLDKYDAEVVALNAKSSATSTPTKPSPAPQPQTPAASDKYHVGTSIKNGVVQNRTGAFSILDNAKRQATANGTKVFDITTGKQVWPEVVAPTTDVKYYRVATDYKNGAYVGQIGAFTNKDNAFATARSNGAQYKVYDPDGKVIFTQNQPTTSQKPQATQTKPVATSQATKVVQAANEMNATMMQDIKNGHQWTYTNKKSMGRTFDVSRSSNYYRTNCNKGVIWVHIKAGVLPEDVNNFYGKKGKFVGTKTVNTYYDVLDFGGKKTAAQLVAAGDLKPGDIISYTNMVHTNMFVGGTQFFDSGHAWCKGSGEDAKMTKWIGNDPYAACPVGQVLRLRENSVMYRVRVGKYGLEDNANNMKAIIKQKTGLDCFYEKVGAEFWVYCGSFNSFSGATDRVVELAKAKIPAEIDEVK